MKRNILIVIELVFLIWFFLPVCLKGIINIGNFVGMCGMGLALIWTVWNEKIELVLAGFRSHKAFFYGEWFFRILCILILLLLVVSAVRIAVAGYQKAPEETPVVVLGCKVNGEKPSRILQERLDAAYTYLSSHEDAVCILSGGKGEDEEISEASCMYQYLTSRGIEEERLIKEDNSTSTEENMKFSKEICEEKGLGSSVVIITSEFHEYRAGLLAKEQGFTVYTYGSSTNLLYFPTYFLREVLGISYMWLKNLFL